MKKFNILVLITCLAMTVIMVQAQKDQQNQIVNGVQTSNLLNIPLCDGDVDMESTSIDKQLVNKLPDDLKFTKNNFIYWQTPNYWGYSNSPGDGRAIGFLANDDFSINLLGIKGDLIEKEYDVVIYYSPDGHSAGSQIFSITSMAGGTGYGWNDIIFPVPFQFNTEVYYVINWRPSDGSSSWGSIDCYQDDGLPFIIEDVTLLEGFSGYNPDPANVLHPYFRISIPLTPPTNLTADLEPVTGEVELNWNYIPTGGFYEDFEDGVADNWIPVTGTWSVGSGNYQASSGSNRINSSYYDEVFSNYEFEIKMRKNIGGAGAMGLFFNGDPSSFNQWGYWDNSYNFHYNTDGEWFLVKWELGSYSWIQDEIYSADINTGLGNWNIIKVVFTNGNIDIYINGILQGTYFDNTFLSGNVGIDMYDYDLAGQGEFDYALLTEISKGYTFGPVSQSKYRDIYSMESQNANDPHLPGTVIGQELAPIPPYKGQYTYVGESTKAFQHFKIYRNSTEIGTTTNTTYTDYLPAYGTYDYEVTAFYDEGESAAAGPVQVIWEGVPDISVLPAYLSDTLLTDGTSVQYLTVYNDGDAVLLADVDIDFISDKSSNPLLIPGKSDNNQPICDDVKIEKSLFPSDKLIVNSNKGSSSVLYVNTMQNYDSDFKTLVSNLPNVNTFDELDAGSTTPNVAYLLTYDVVMVASSYPFANATLLGDNLATYVDEGGKVCLLEATFNSGGGWTLLGDFTNPALFYCPLEVDSSVQYNVSCNTFVPHPITNGVSSIETGLYALTHNSACGFSLGNYGPGGHVVAYNVDKPIVAINVFAYNGYWGGDFIQMISNTIDWLTGNMQWLSLNQNIFSVDPDSSQIIEVTFDATGLATGIYTADINITSNDPDEPLVIVPVTLNVVDPLSAELKAFLEGPFSIGEMTPSLNILGYIPLNQPYNVAPWNYTGTESVGAIPNSDVVDWVLVELRETLGDASTATSGTVIGQKAGFILKDGSIVHINGISHLVFNLVATQNVFAVVYHRNHIGIMSANPLAGGGSAYNYNFTTGAGQAYGGSLGHKEIGAGVWGMIGGDGNADKQIANSDKNDVWAVQAGTSGYLSGD
ncbi:MAG: hypothetical protein K8R58_00405, partial [Bacteroidales bacterium]|nr:hypothetical protein [Bacteroidales bacterium]